MIETTEQMADRLKRRCQRNLDKGGRFRKRSSDAVDALYAAAQVPLGY